MEETGRPTDAVALAEALEEWLGDPRAESNSTSFVRALELDEREELPADGIRQVRAFGFNRYFVPEWLGGDLRSTEELLMLTRVIARRDMNVAVSESTQVWMMLAWIGGDAEQREKWAATVLRGGVIPCLAYSEPGHGADLAANDLAAVPDGGQYVLTGEKWPINRGRTSTHVVLLGTTGDDDVPAKRRQSMFLVDRSQVVSGEVTGVPRVPTYGLRGCDISGVAFQDARVDAGARLGAEGEGLELSLRGLLITRTLCTGLSLGTGDTMLRTVSGFLSGRTLYDGPASEIPYVSESLANAYLSLLVAECESLVAMRGLHLYTEEFSVWGNAAKVQVARLVDFGGKALARTLGARYYMRAPEHAGIFQKMLRDGAVVSVFDGSEPVCLDSISLQLAALAKSHERPRDEDWSTLYDLRAPLPPFRPARVSVFGRGRDAVLASLPALLDRLARLTPSAGCDEERLTALRAGAEEVRQRLDALYRRFHETRRSPAQRTDRPTTSAKTTSPQLLRLAEELCDLHARVAALGVWLHNRDHLDAFFADGAWLQAALVREQVHEYRTGDLDPATARALFDRMNSQRENDEFFSIRTVRQAAPGAREADLDDLSPATQ
ncbi:acyl-CoA dehydrogenase family protein [Streptomyces griseomycini]|uniref:Alkylation response protein AidB-like acyl-CoA dehydrogenase n=1 Tax=Streptomyces griseomycini TaxID=66895 RepID=A0A7W7LW44_9ACTN|nr:acyl-CoA dehydrogenase family protein [Streptomyces griseomycini]MBB4896666.1 alkylation response protein AidB-like acyl-CoA dehydrogenase [Streptomyces griseomycini]GGP85907.1 acyl-CoA dehydrogenase [Streptomyces griseomycini]GGR00824.1 acyl-CoA dehydrogenase [Streptomyces griseomycini]